jgi:hypothetical protein
MVYIILRTGLVGLMVFDNISVISWLIKTEDRELIISIIQMYV